MIKDNKELAFIISMTVVILIIIIGIILNLIKWSQFPKKNIKNYKSKRPADISINLSSSFISQIQKDNKDIYIIIESR